MVSQEDYIYIALGALGAVLLTSYVPSLMKVMSTYPPDYANYPGLKEIKLEDISGIDNNALVIVRNKGFS